MIKAQEKLSTQTEQLRNSGQLLEQPAFQTDKARTVTLRADLSTSFDIKDKARNVHGVLTKPVTKTLGQYISER